MQPARLLSIFVVIATAGLGWPVSAQRFYPDDPLVDFPETQDASGMEERPVSQAYDWLENALLRSGDHTHRRAANINTVDEVPNSGWFENRIGTRSMDLNELTRGPDQFHGPAPGRLRITSGKTAGITPGFRMRDERGDLYFVKFDPRRFPELATAAEVISTKLLHALGYHVPENYVLSITRDRLDITNATVTGPSQRRRPMTEDDLDRLLGLAGRQPDGTYRILASRAVPGVPLGPFQYYGTRPDDPNDIIPHEHRRELRGLRVFAAWINHADSRGVNSLDTLVETEGRHVVRHYLLDFGSTLGSAGVDQKSRRSGNEYLWDIRQSIIRMLTFGVIIPDWTRVEYPRHQGVGRFEARQFQPEAWVPHYPNPAFDNLRADDAFWAARRVMAFSDEGIRAIVKTGELSDGTAERYLADTLIARRDAIGRAWLTGVLPLVDFSLTSDGTLRFHNIAAFHGVSTPPPAYRLRWSAFDNEADDSRLMGTEITTISPVARMPQELLDAQIDYVKVAVEAEHPDHPAWSNPVEVYFRRAAHGWETVGLYRLGP